MLKVLIIYFIVILILTYDTWSAPIYDIFGRQIKPKKTFKELFKKKNDKTS
jgi:hypothetical protein